MWRVRCFGGDFSFGRICEAGAMVDFLRCCCCWVWGRLKGGGGGACRFCALDCLLRGVREAFGLGPGEEDFVGVRVEAALRLEKEGFLINAGLSGVEGIDPPMRRLAMDVVKDCGGALRIGATVGAAYISGILGTGGALTGVVKALFVPELFNDGIDFFILR